MNKKSKIVKYLVVVIVSTIFFSTGHTQFFISAIEDQNCCSKKDTIPQVDCDVETKIRIFLYEKYHPGSCYGMPGPVDERVMQSTLRGNSHLIEIIKNKFQVYSDYEIYIILISIKSLLLEQSKEGYKFSFIDGDCCVITNYDGILYLHNDVIIRSEIISKKSRKVEC